MILACPYCSYRKEDIPLSEPILKLIVEGDMPFEDDVLWIERMIKQFHSKTRSDYYSGVKIHMGRMHREKRPLPMIILNELEKDYMDRYKVGL